RRSRDCGEQRTRGFRASIGDYVRRHARPIASDRRSPHEVTEGVPLSARHLPVAADAVLLRVDGRHHVRYRLPVPYFGFLWAPLVARRARAVERAADA